MQLRDCHMYMSVAAVSGVDSVEDSATATSFDRTAFLQDGAEARAPWELPSHFDLMGLGDGALFAVHNDANCRVPM